MPISLDRRALIASLATLAAAQRLRAAPVTQAVAAHDPFALGVASGEPGPDGVVLWTRLVGQGAQPLDLGAVLVRWEVATDANFRRIVMTGRRRASPEAAHSVHVELGGLAPGAVYFYRFHALGATSPIGRAITLPLTAERLRIAAVSCQHWEQGWFRAYRDIVATAPDLVVHLGDYIYERSFGEGPVVRRFPLPEPMDLVGYRARHALYKTDMDLQAAHQALSWVFTWDDHEVSNDYAGLDNIHEMDPAAFFRRRTAAYQAYFEHLPIRPSRWGSASDPRLYHRFEWGKLASIQVLDGRSRRSPHPCSAPGRRGGRPLAACDALDDPERSMLGGEQESWLDEQLATEDCRWSLIAQQTMVAPMVRVPGGVPMQWTDDWNGYPKARERLLASLCQPAVRNAVILSADLHCFFVSDIGLPGEKPVATEYLTSSIASRTQGDAPFGAVLARNPHIRFKDTASSGYILLDVTPSAITAQIRVIDDMTRADAKCATSATFVTRDGHAGAYRGDPSLVS